MTDFYSFCGSRCAQAPVELGNFSPRGQRSVTQHNKCETRRQRKEELCSAASHRWRELRCKQRDGDYDREANCFSSFILESACGLHAGAQL